MTLSVTTRARLPLLLPVSDDKGTSAPSTPTFQYVAPPRPVGGPCTGGPYDEPTPEGSTRRPHSETCPVRHLTLPGKRRPASQTKVSLLVRPEGQHKEFDETTFPVPLLNSTRPWTDRESGPESRG